MMAILFLTLPACSKKIIESLCSRLGLNDILSFLEFRLLLMTQISLCSWKFHAVAFSFLSSWTLKTALPGQSDHLFFTDQSKCPVPSSSPSSFAVPSNIPAPPSPLAVPETTSFAPPKPVTPLRAPRDLSPCQFRRHMGNHIPLCDMSIQAPRWYISASLSGINHIQPTWISTCRHHSIQILHVHRLFPTIEKLKDNRMTIRGEPTLPRNHEPMNHEVKRPHE